MFVIGRQGLGQERSNPEGTTQWPAAEEEEVGRFSSDPSRETESVSTKEEFGNEKEGGGRDRGRNSQQGPRRQAEAASPRDAEPLARTGGLHRACDETRQCRAGENGGRGSSGVGHILERTWPEQVQGVYY
ncbi:hypothetical protein NDU88_003614 [Pleurodeles waltl]|uniref:Uncharacterized protein n=1 Tax=Pleurodeles waltl TaxID=8319 RepID=A0AAV7PF52_PLEWA|nr:hypothetical protein NDU88_003614 [Pleurodeles waltl]